MLFLFIVVPEGCERGITFADFYHNTLVLNKSEYSGVTRDLNFILSFCPEETGIYDIFYNGSIDPSYESTWSSYIFNGTRQESRKFKTIELREGTCYPVRIGHSSCCDYAWGRLEYTHNGITKLFSSDDSFTCYKGWCKNGEEFPACTPTKTTKFTYQTSRLNKLFALLLGMLMAQ